MTPASAPADGGARRQEPVAGAAARCGAATRPASSSANASLMSASDVVQGAPAHGVGFIVLASWLIGPTAMRRLQVTAAKPIKPATAH